jgi:hypothetical protein
MGQASYPSLTVKMKLMKTRISKENYQYLSSYPTFLEDSSVSFSSFTAASAFLLWSSISPHSLAQSVGSICSRIQSAKEVQYLFEKFCIIPVSEKILHFSRAGQKPLFL